jgi:hypothetical protein
MCRTVPSSITSRSHPTIRSGGGFREGHGTNDGGCEWEGMEGMEVMIRLR